MPFELSIKYYTLPKDLTDQYLIRYIIDDTFDDIQSARIYMEENFFSIKHELFNENSRWKIRLFLYSFPKYLYDNFVESKKIGIFDSYAQAKKYADKKTDIYCYSIRYTDKTSDFAAIEGL